VDPNLPVAANWYLKAAELGLASAMNSFGELSEGGTLAQQCRGFFFARGVDRL
jgi:TPR repeat protein